MSRSEDDLRKRIAETVRAWFRDTKTWGDDGMRVIRETPEYIQVYIDGKLVVQTMLRFGDYPDHNPPTVSDPD